MSPWTKRTKASARTHPEGPVLHYLYDLTTSAHWAGVDVGILRVERQFARRAREHLGSAVEFCVYDRFRNLVLTIGDDLALGIIAGRIQIDFTTPTPRSVATRARSRLNEVRRRLRRAVLGNATLYHALQRLRGRTFTRHEILQIQAGEFAGSELPEETRIGPIPIADAPHRVAHLDPETLLISGGLDWDFKDMRALAALKRQHGFRYCTIIYDMIPILFPHLVVPSLVPVFERYFADLLGLADRAMCISETTRRDWAHFCQQHGVDIPAWVFPLGSNLPALEDSPAVEFPEALQDKQFALFVSTIEPRKNHRMLYEAWDRCVRSRAVDAKRDRLVFVGRLGWAINDLMGELSVNPATRETLIVLNHVSDALLRLLYQRAIVVVFPSLYEGYGLPLAEALAYGKPCISSNTGSLPEIGEGLVVRLDPQDTIGWADALAHYFRSTEEREVMAARVRAEFHPVTWDQAAAKFFSIIKGIAG